jgi:serpin B
MSTPTQATPEDWQKLDERVRLSRIAVEAQNEFGKHLLGAVVQQNPGKNILLSPLSVFLALAMAESGSGSSTRSAMRKTLAVPEGDEAGLHESIDALTRVLRMPGGAEFLVANALWAGEKAPISPAFIQLCQTAFGAQASTLQFADPKSAKVINDWVSANTKGKIPEIVTPDMIRSAMLILTNAVYFAGKWNRQFSKGDTQNEQFHRSNGTAKPVAMMHDSDRKLGYRSGSGFEGVAMPYQGSSICFYALLPEKGKSAADLLAKLDARTVIDGPAEYDVDLKMPRFGFDFGASLTPYLKKLGMAVAFEYPEADFKPMGSELLYISDVIHKTRIEVDEEGTVAAAATAVLMMAGSAMPKPREKKVLVFDRPFVVVIADARTKAVLFAGVVEDPL